MSAANRSDRDHALYEAIGRAIRTARTDGGMTQTALADAMGLFPASLSRAEHGRQRFTVSTVYRYAEALGVDPRGLLP